MSEFVIVHGSVKIGPTAFLGPGDTINLSEKDAKAMDPTGECFVPKAKYEAQNAKAARPAKTAEPKPAEPEKPNGKK